MRLAIIPARGGSKRIPRKNIKLFHDKPIIAYSIEAALKSGVFDEVMVSTDDEEIAHIAREFGAKTPFLRSDQNSNDTATTFDVLKEVHNWYAEQGQLFESACCIYPCAPFVTSELIKETFQRLTEGNFDSVYPIVHYSAPIQRALKTTDSGRIEMINPEFALTRTQDLERSFFDAGMLYTYKVNSLMETGMLLTKNTGYIELDELYVQDIDNLTDWKLAELKYDLLK